MLRNTLFLILLCSLSTSALAKPSEPLLPQPEHNMATRLITQFINDYHYKESELNDQQSEQILKMYLEGLDPSRSFFTQADITLFHRYHNTLDDALRKGDISPAFLIYQRFNQRRLERANYALDRLKQPFDFTLDESLIIDRSELPWAKSSDELDEIWRKRVKNDVLNLLLAKKDQAAIEKTLGKRYQRIITHVEQTNAEDTYEFFMNAYLRSIEPHTSYFSPHTSENFKINMSLSLEGIGAVLSSEDDMTRVQKIIPGGPADLSDQIGPKDYITGVAQGEKGEMEDVVGWRLDDVVDLIRGPKDSVVRLQLLPKESGLDGPYKEITLVRNKIKLEEQQAKSSIIELPGEPGKKIGVITIPTFYMDFEGYRRGDEDYRSTTRDALALIDELQQQSIDGLVIDLRNNGGGSLPEAVSLTGLFIKKGPVVQIHDSEGKTKSNDDTDSSIAYNGPLAVLVNRYSASASEIFAGAIKDYGRGVIIGEPTYGKGTVQTLIDLDRYVRDDSLKIGQLKLTMAQFFRINGDSTQHRGVLPDIRFPTAEEDADQGERALENALPWASIKPARFSPYQPQAAVNEQITHEHLQRVAKDPGFTFLLAQAEQRHLMKEKSSLSLLQSTRQTERDSLKQQQDERINQFRISQGLPPLETDQELGGDEEEMEHDGEDSTVKAIEQIELREAAHILNDIINSEQPRTAHQPQGGLFRSVMGG